MDLNKNFYKSKNNKIDTNISEPTFYQKKRLSNIKKNRSYIPDSINPNLNHYKSRSNNWSQLQTSNTECGVILKRVINKNGDIYKLNCKNVFIKFDNNHDEIELDFRDVIPFVLKFSNNHIDILTNNIIDLLKKDNKLLLTGLYNGKYIILSFKYSHIRDKVIDKPIEIAKYGEFSQGIDGELNSFYIYVLSDDKKNFNNIFNTLNLCLITNIDLYIL